MNTFQTILLGIFGLFIVAGVVILATYKGSDGGGSGVPVVVWGTESESDFNTFTHFIFQSSKSLSVTYEKKSEASFDQELIEALASGRGPDVILLPHDSILRYRDKIAPISFDIVSEGDFKNTFITEGELFLSPLGALGLPFSIDPLVMYWNRSIFSNSGLASPPAFWDEFSALSKVMTEKDKVLNIRKSFVALGESANISHSKDIVSALIMQAGNPVVVSSTDGRFESALRADSSATEAISFYTEFANPVKPQYSWNRSLPNSLSFFLSGNLALYFGFASELNQIAEKNPNLDFDVTHFPQLRNSAVKMTFGKMKALSILKNSRNSDAVTAVIALTSASALAKWTEISGLPPVRRDLANTRASSAFGEIFYASAIRSRAWFDPKPSDTASIFRSMIESITGGRMQTVEALNRADGQLDALLRQE